MVAQSPPPIVAFAQLPAGWHRTYVPGLALSWRYRPSPSGWAPAMPRNGIAVHVFFVNDKPHYPPLKLLIPRSPATTLEGAPDTPEYRIHGQVDGHDVEIWIDIRRPHPTQRQLRLAQTVVSAIRFKSKLPGA